MKILIQVGQLLLSLSILIILHELGHFIFARLFKTRVEKFYLFFNPWFSLFKVKKGETEYGIGWLPLGGYVKISGMIDESMDKEQLKQPPQPYEFRSKPAWKRLLIMLGGVLVNVLLGIAIYSMILFKWGDKYLPNENLNDGFWVTDSLMNEIGLRTGDKFVTIGGVTPVSFSDAVEEMLYSSEMVINRNGTDTTIQIPEDFIGRISDNRIHYKGPLLLERQPFIIKSIPDSSQNSGSGLMPKDHIIRINEHPVKYFDQFYPIADSLRGQTVLATVIRNKEQLQLKLLINQDAKLMVEPLFLDYDDLERFGYYQFATFKYTFLEAIPAGLVKAMEMLRSYLRGLKRMFDFKSGAHKAIGGFGAIGSLFPPVWDWQIFWSLTAFLSLMLAFLNILPIPALDGGHVAFLLYEIVTGRKPGDKFLEYAQLTGMFLLLMLLLYANGNDLYRWILRLIGK